MKILTTDSLSLVVAEKGQGIMVTYCPEGLWQTLAPNESELLMRRYTVGDSPIHRESRKIDWEKCQKWKTVAYK